MVCDIYFIREKTVCSLMIYTPPDHDWEFHATAEDKPPYEFQCRVCGIKNYSQDKFDKFGYYIWPKREGCDEELHLAYEVMAS
jgi:hypothetical protein